MELHKHNKVEAELQIGSISVVYNAAFLKRVFVFYCLLLLYIVFFTPNRYEGYYQQSHMHLIPLEMTLDGLKGPRGQHFWAYWYEYFGNLFGNIMLFMPMGFLLKAFNRKRSTWRIVLAGALISASIELLQYVFKIGVCDIDDVILNTLGTWSGVLVFTYLKDKEEEEAVSYELRASSKIEHATSILKCFVCKHKN